MVEAEQMAAVAEILTALGFDDFVIRINHRKFISAWLSRIPIPVERHADVLVTIDKVDKVGKEGVARELGDKGFGEAQIAGVVSWIGSQHSAEWLESIASQFDGADAGLDNLRQIVRLASRTGAAGRLRIDPSLARGLGYYTGAIMEVNVADLPGSLAGGGRYDNLIGMFLGSDVPACGVSLGLERILVVMQERGMFPPEVERSGVDVVVAAMDETAQDAAMETAALLRRSGDLRVDVYPDVARKMDKIFRYVDQRKARFIAMLGTDEIAAGTVTLRNVATKARQTVSRSEAAALLRNLNSPTTDD
jgi:histidyl-tRNA synthetase